METQPSLDITWKTIVKVVLAGLLLYALFLTRKIVIWFFFALVISLLLEPAVRTLRRARIPRAAAVLLIYFGAFGALGLLVYLVSPLFLLELKQFSRHIPEYFTKVSPLLQGVGINVSQDFDAFTASLVDTLKNSSGSIVRSLMVFFGGAASSLSIFTLAFFLSLKQGGFERALILLFPKEHEQRAAAIFRRSQEKVSGWFGARIIACLFVGAVSFLVFLLLGVHYAFILALLSGVLNFIPFVGPAVMLVLAAVSIGVTDSWVLALYAMIALVVIQETENKLLTPMLMKKFMDIPPVLVLLALLAGGTLFGFLGMIFMIPVAGIAYEFAKEFLERRREGPAATAAPVESLR